jgi:GNAT superfamily N-acetyltransferase
MRANPDHAGNMFALTQELLDDIIFWMEDQNADGVIDVETGRLIHTKGEHAENGGSTEIRAGQDKVPDGYRKLPAWGPPDGFGIMEDFTASLQNPPARKKLAAALNRGKGVFRAFKDVLAEFPEVEKRWFAYKDEALKKAVYAWYAALCEDAGIEKIGVEPEETDELVDEDFHFSLKKENRKITIIAYNALDKQAGKIYAAEEGHNLVILELLVEEAFRGLGLGESLLKRLLAEHAGVVTIDLPAESGLFSRVLSRENFAPVMTRYQRPVPNTGARRE